MKILNLILILTIALNISCKKNDDQPQNPNDLLPPVSQTGKQTFGCLINGKAFVPDNFGEGRPNAFYQYVDGKYFLGINSHNSQDTLKGISIFADDILLEEEKTYNFSNEDGDNLAFFADYTVKGGFEAYYETTSLTTGHIYISKFDQKNNIISGTFEYTAKDRRSEKVVEVTDGRFDLTYTN